MQEATKETREHQGILSILSRHNVCVLRHKIVLEHCLDGVGQKDPGQERDVALVVSVTTCFDQTGTDIYAAGPLTARLLDGPSN